MVLCENLERCQALYNYDALVGRTQPCPEYKKEYEQRKCYRELLVDPQISFTAYPDHCPRSSKIVFITPTDSVPLKYTVAPE
ncbi:hypothetical protein AKO1_011930 [Acrasis kona]|uniref:Uncharacterized protein n=1 Tax=Acrasis kona TaxID=1008807 RepID=A0AAW2Z8S2_9EUKA